MTLAEFYEILKQSQIPFSYRFWKEKEKPKLPYGVYYSTGSNNFQADGIVYQSANEIVIELYTNNKAPAIEQKLETVLTNAGLFFEKDEIYLSDEKMLEIIYNLEVWKWVPIQKTK